MSCFTTIRTKIKDLDVLKKCLGDMGYRVVVEEKQKLIVKTPRGYDISFREGPDGNWEIVASSDVMVVRDELKRDLESRANEIEREIERDIKRKYALEKVIKETRKMGFSVVEQKQIEDKTIKLVVRRFR